MASERTIKRYKGTLKSVRQARDDWQKAAQQWRDRYDDQYEQIKKLQADIEGLRKIKDDSLTRLNWLETMARLAVDRIAQVADESHQHATIRMALRFIYERLQEELAKHLPDQPQDCCNAQPQKP